MTQDEFFEIYPQIERDVERLAQHSIELGLVENFDFQENIRLSKSLKLKLEGLNIPQKYIKDIIETPVEFYSSFMEIYRPCGRSYYRQLMMRTSGIQRAMRNWVRSSKEQ